MISCLVCSKELKSLSVHVKVHEMTLEQYREKFKNPESGEYPPTGYSISGSIKGTTYKTREQTPVPLPTFVQPKIEHSDRFTLLYSQADEDPALAPAIKAVVENEQRIVSLQNRLKSTDDLDEISKLSKVIKDMQSTNLSLMESMNLTRKSKQATKSSPQTTPSKMVTALENFSKMFPPEQWARMQRDIQDSERRIQKNIKELKESLETTIGTEENATGEDVW